MTARSMYVKGYSLADIAKRLGVPERTVGEWSAKEDWGKLRTATRISRDEIVNKNLTVIGGLLEYLDQTELTPATIKDYASITDQITKLTSVIDKLGGDTQVKSALAVTEDFIVWCEKYLKAQKADESILDQIDELATLYVQDLIKQE